MQDIASDDTTDAGLENDMAWVARRTAVELRATPGFREPLTPRTFCSGFGSRWAERRVSIVGDAGRVDRDGVALGAPRCRVRVGPSRCPADFHAIYGEAAAGRMVSARLQHESEVPADAVRLPWALRFTDFDLLGHVNNAATWAMVEEVAGRPTGTCGLRCGPSSSTACRSSAAIRSSWPPSSGPTARCPSG